MMPSVLRRSGPDFMRGDQRVTPRAVIDICDGCGFEGASFAQTLDGKRISFCGIEPGTLKFVCVGKGRQPDLAGAA